MTKIKLCGLSRIEDIELANQLAPEYVGFVFWEKSKRNVSLEQARLLREKLDESILSAGVFVDADMEYILTLVQAGIINIVQLHGHEDEAYIRDLRKLADCPIIKAFCIRNDEDMELANISSADMVLLDSGMGTGVTFDWRRLKHVSRSYILAGGLNPSNIVEAVTTLHPFGVDVSSGIETDGLKDPAKMREFVRLVREQNDFS